MKYYKQQCSLLARGVGGTFTGQENTDSKGPLCNCGILLHLLFSIKYDAAYDKCFQRGKI